jgi:DASS family divalent anion:Na+ symporter
MPPGAVALTGLLLAVLSGNLSMSQGLAGYSSPIIWLIVFVFFVARGFIKTRLGLRIGYHFISLLGRRSLGLGYGIVATELLIAPLVPSNAARAGGIMFPLVRSICEALNSRPEDHTQERLGVYLSQVCLHGNTVTSAMFLTAMAANPFMQALASGLGVNISWGSWFMAASVPGLLTLALLPWVLYRVCPPQFKQLPDAPAIARDQLRIMGPISRKEWVMLGIFATMLSLWIFAKDLGIPSETTALLGVIGLLLSGILTFDDILAEREAWHTMLWLSILITLAEYLQKWGFVAWFSQGLKPVLMTPHWPLSLGLIVLIYFYSHYLFASITAHVSAMYAAFLTVAIAAGAPPVLAALVLGFSSSLFACLTHYGSSSSVIFYGAGYVSTARWWGIGFVVGLLFLGVWGLSGAVWWRVLGLW